MKMRNSILESLGNHRIGLAKLTIKEEKRYENSPLNNIIEIPLKNSDKRYLNCYECQDFNSNWCWNCEKPHCDNHARAIFILSASIINTFCLDCAKELENIIMKLKNNKLIVKQK